MIKITFLELDTILSVFRGKTRLFEMLGKEGNLIFLQTGDLSLPRVSAMDLRVEE